VALLDAAPGLSDGLGRGFVAIVHDGMVIFCQDDDLAPFLVAVDAKTGKEKWKTLRKDMLAGYALPVICEANGRTISSSPAAAR
jgi:outer membrane protein assembly factor BamB